MGRSPRRPQPRGRGDDAQRHLTQLVHDVEPASGRSIDRPELAYALDQLVPGRVAGLVLAHLGDLTRSVTELAQLLPWMNQARPS